MSGLSLKVPFSGQNCLGCPNRAFSKFFKKYLKWKRYEQAATSKYKPLSSTKKNFKKRENRIIFVVAEELMEHQLKWVPVMDK